MNAGVLRVLVAKDLRVYLTDRRAVVLSFVAPLLFASFFAVAFGGGPGSGGPGETASVRVSVAVLDDSEVARAIVAGLAADRSLYLSAEATADEARMRVRDGAAVVAIVIPSGFGADAALDQPGTGSRPGLTLFHDPSRRAEALLVRSLATCHAILALSSRPSIPFEVREVSLNSGTDQARAAANAHAFGGMAVQFLLFGAIEQGVGLLAERQKGLWRRLRAAPVSRPGILLARVVSGTILSLLILAAIFGFGALAFGLRVVGSPVAFALICVLYASTASSLGLLIAAMGRTPQAARGLSVLAVLVMVMLGGAWVPTSAFPDWLRRLTLIVPTRWAVDGFDATLGRGSGLVEAGGIILALAGFTAAFTTLAVLRFRREPD